MASKGIEASIIGAGSARFSAEFARDMCLTPGLHGSNIRLFDPNQDRLNWATNFANRYAKEVGVDMRFEKVSARRDAIRGVDFVINTALAGGRETTERTRRLLVDQYDYYRGINMNVPDAQLQLMLEIAREVAELSPEATILQSSNPLAEGATLMQRETGLKNVIGLCHGHLGVTEEIAPLLELDPKKVSFTAPGFNHNIWMTKFEYNGKDAYPILDDWIKNNSEQFWQQWEPNSCHWDYQLTRAAMDLYRIYGLMPIGDTTRASFSETWWYHTDRETKEKWYGPTGGFDSDKGGQLNLQRLGENLEIMQEAAENPHLSVTKVFPPDNIREQLVPVINSIVNDIPAQYQVNIMNNGNTTSGTQDLALKGLPNDVVVEVPAIVDGKGVRRLEPLQLPDSVHFGVIIPRWLMIERVVRAFQQGDLSLLLQTMLLDHKTRTYEQAAGALERLMEIPGNECMQERYRRSTRIRELRYYSQQSKL